MRKIRYRRSGRLLSCTDSAYLLPTVADDELAEALAESIADAIATEVDIRLGDVEVTLAMLLDPDHWGDDWRDLGIENVDEFLAGLVEVDE